MKKFVEPYDKEGEGFAFLHEKVPQKGEAKITAGAFDDL